MGDEDDDTADLPLVVPVSDTIGAVELGKLVRDDHQVEPDSDVAPTERRVVESGSDVAPTERRVVESGSDLAPTERQAVQPPSDGGRVTATPVGGTPVATVTYSESSRSPRWGRRIAIVLAVVLVVAAGYYAFNLWQVWSTGRSDEARSADAIVVMGAAQYDGRPSPQLEARLDHVVSLWSDGIAPTVIVTGGNQPGDRFTEAEASGSYLIEQGVASDAILYENVGSNTYDSLVGVASIMGERGLETAVIVTDPYHALRSELTAEELGISASSSPTPDSVVTGGAELRRQLGEAAGVALGRIIGFDRLASLSG